MKDELVSIIIPVYNVANYLNDCLCSTINQSYKNLEIIIVDDGSTDGSSKICDDYVSKDDRCIVIHQENQGLSSARNRALEIAKGDYIYLLDGDDYIHHNTIEVLYNALQEGNYDLAFGGHNEVDSYKEPEKTLSIESVKLTSEELLMYLFDSVPKNVTYLSDADLISVTNKLFKKKLINNRLFTPMHFEDVEYSTYIMLQSPKTVYIKNNLYFNVQRKGSITHLSVNANTLDRLKAYVLSLQQIPKENEFIRGLCIIKMFKVISFLRKITANTSFEKKAKDVIERVVKDIKPELIENKTIALNQKCLLLFLYRFPFVYSACICFFEFLYKCKNRSV